MTDTLTAQHATERTLDTILSRSKPHFSREEVGMIHHVLSEHSGLTAERFCGAQPMKAGGALPSLRLRHYKHGTSTAAWSGLQRSKAYSCIIANIVKVMRQREENSYLAQRHRENGGAFIAGTFTMRSAAYSTPASFYSREEQLRKANPDHEGTVHELKREAWDDFLVARPRANSWEAWDLHRRLDAVNDGIKRMFNGGSPWTRDRDAYKIAGRILTVETVVTPTVEATPSGSLKPSWKKVQHNVHIHVLFLVDMSPAELSQLELAPLKRRLWGRWQKAMVEHGFTSTLGAQHLVEVGVSEADVQRQASYLAKPIALASAASTDSEGQTDFLTAGVENSFDLFSTLSNAIGFGVFDNRGELHDPSAEAKLWWQNFEGAVAGRHFYRVSPPLFARYGIKEFRERTKDEYKAKIAEVEICCHFDRDVWNEYIRRFPARRAELIALAERHGGEAVREYLTEAGIPFLLPGDSAPPSRAEAETAHVEHAA